MVAITDQSVSRVDSVGYKVAATYTLNTSGAVQKTEGGSTTTLETWLQAGAAGDYEVRATKLSGDTPTGSALATWLPLSSTQAWTLTDAVNDGIPLTCTLTVESATPRPARCRTRPASPSLRNGCNAYGNRSQGVPNRHVENFPPPHRPRHRGWGVQPYIGIRRWPQGCLLQPRGQGQLVHRCGAHGTGRGRH